MSPAASSLASSRLRVLLAGFALLAAACDGGPTDPPAADPGATLTVDASSATAWALVDLASPAQQVQAADPAASPAWDLAFQVTKVAVNGGAAGPGGVTAHCLCQNAAASNDQVRAMTPESELQDFQAVTRDQVPASPEAWSAAVFDEQRWYRYNLTGSDHQVWPTFDVYLVRRGNEVYKVQVTGYYGADGKARQITFRYARLTS